MMRGFRAHNINWYKRVGTVRHLQLVRPAAEVQWDGRPSVELWPLAALIKTD